MASTRRGKVVYTPHPNPHPDVADAPRTGVPVNPVPHKGGPGPTTTIKQVTGE